MVGHSSNGLSRGFKDVVHQPSFELSAQAIGLDVETLDDNLLGFIFVISRVPELFPITAQDSDGIDLCTALYRGVPRLRFWFTYDDNNVYMWYVTGG